MVAFIKTDWSSELDQVKTAIGEVVDNNVSPMISGAISQASGELGTIVRDASAELQLNIKVLSQEIHDQRRMTGDEIRALIDYAAERIASTVDERLAVAKKEVSTLVIDKIERVKAELEDAAIRSRKTLYFNVAVSIGAALAMGAIGVVYRKITLNELDVFSLFRVVLLSTATGTGLFAALKLLNSWNVLNKHKKNVTTIALNYVGVLRPNGALRLLVLSVLLACAWGVITFYPF
ncbi:hypothetical protein G4G28_20065 [Massilia sp. Dwa41.01b]|uniref:hypothetical protein n=1 Tax=unclassified Massilia TaxID=2609279 RepID=UPI0015FF8ACE|nr:MULTISPECIES: hypothetical protein [unclassified Massilia]QNA90222.1 hypothetical protein G4G28_20065 [Massilia sp. Dwa41.01b]QNB01109.1 hypothetical protein G4G31_23665 [Massilia sp. Se16.2.3]